MANETWQPAVLLPLDRMCSFHRKLWDTFADAESREDRARHEGKRIFVLVTDRVVVNWHQVVPNGECVPLSVKNEAGELAGAFSCEVSTD